MDAVGRFRPAVTGDTIELQPMRKVLLVVALAAAVAGCTSTRAAAPIERPTLAVPPPPPRVIEAAPPPEVPNLEPIPPLPPEKPASQAKPRPGSRDATARDTQKPETTKPEPAPASTPVQEPPPSTTTVPPVPAVRTPATPDTSAADRRIRDSLRGTEDIFRTIDRGRLRAERQTAYDDAKGSIDGAYAALKSANFELAQQMADKADKLVRELQTR